MLPGWKVCGVDESERTIGIFYLGALYDEGVWKWWVCCTLDGEGSVIVDGKAPAQREAQKAAQDALLALTDDIRKELGK